MSFINSLSLRNLIVWGFGGVVLTVLLVSCFGSSDTTTTTTTSTSNTDTPGFRYQYPMGSIFEYEIDINREFQSHITYDEALAAESAADEELTLDVTVGHTGWLRYHPNPGADADTTNLLILSEIGDGEISATLNQVDYSPEDADNLDYRDAPDINHLLTIDPRGEEVESPDSTRDLKSEYLDMLIGFTEGPLGGVAASLNLVGEWLLSRPLSPIFPDGELEQGSVWTYEFNEDGPAGPLVTSARFEIVDDQDEVWAINSSFQTPGFTYDASDDFTSLAELLEGTSLSPGPDEYTENVTLTLEYIPAFHTVEFLVDPQTGKPLGGKAETTGGVTINHEGRDLTGLPLSTSTSSTIRQIVEFSESRQSQEGFNVPDLEAQGSPDDDGGFQIEPELAMPPLEDPLLVEGICGRSETIQTAILGELGETDCSVVVEELLQRVTHINVAGQEMTEILASDLQGLSSVIQIDLSNNQLTSLPDDLFSDLPNLIWVTLSNNRLTEIPDELFSQNRGLLVLELGSNNIGQIPTGLLSDLNELQTLQLSRNQLSELPLDLLAGLEDLESLQLEQNQLQRIAPEFFAGATNLKIVDLSFNNLTDLESFAHGVTAGWERLELRGNEIRTVSAADLDQMIGLLGLDLSSNQISTIEPGAFSELTGLTRLDLSQNELERLDPGVWEGLDSLTEIDLSENRLAETPDLSGIPTLDTIDVGEQSIP